MEREAWEAISGSIVPRMRFTLPTQASKWSSATARSLLLTFSIPCSPRSQSSDVRWVCFVRDVIPIRRRAKRGQTASRCHITLDRANRWPGPLTFATIQVAGAGALNAKAKNAATPRKPNATR